MPLVYIALGSNLGDRCMLIKQACRELSTAPGVVFLRCSAVIETDPIGPEGQGRYLNAVAEIETELAPRELLKICQGIENKLGRVRQERWGARTIDLDIILYGDQTISELGLEIPHPEMHKRAFVLTPLCELAPELRHPVLKLSARELLAKL